MPVLLHHSASGSSLSSRKFGKVQRVTPCDLPLGESCSFAAFPSQVIGDALVAAGRVRLINTEPTQHGVRVSLID